MGPSDTNGSGDLGKAAAPSIRGGARVPVDLGTAGVIEDQEEPEGRMSLMEP